MAAGIISSPRATISNKTSSPRRTIDAIGGARKCGVRRIAVLIFALRDPLVRLAPEAPGEGKVDEDMPPFRQPG